MAQPEADKEIPAKPSAQQPPAVDPAKGDAEEIPVGDQPAAGAVETEPVPAEVKEAKPAEAETVGHETEAADVDAAFVDSGVLAGGGLLALITAGLVGAMLRRSPASVEDEEDQELDELGDDDSLIQEMGVSAPAPSGQVPGLAARLRERMSQSRAALQGRLDQLFAGGQADDGLLEELEDLLLTSDVGLATTERLVESVRSKIASGVRDPRALREALRDEMLSLLASVHRPFTVPQSNELFVVLIVGVNGSGKTTTIGKLAAHFRNLGHKVLLAAGDTYRAAAADQLEIWADRTSVDIVRHDEGADPGAVVFDAMDAAKARECDVVLVDTAGRLQTKRPLMEQLGKIRRIIDKKASGGPHETWLVIDGTQGQNALSQARSFHEVTPLTGVVVTKLDGTAKGGMVLAVAAQMKLPVRFIGIGERVEDLRPFEPDAFVEALL